ncbi:flagellar assembly peptidoglycan hydrolase FlgJ [Motilimonas eburnea]|uniref:flagellar assembly peptidoglycan hydrolase FlgJ n=1 Tax=Motilimonas eburnea TaxID=1737488 RepID=UPI001E31307C|nr:flagellar assembly peptidoglycan hydrolase FlgJ [Motilimonas eburnea]MCE2571555.1 flagellar assembly peptidoglycan hydrolase FlgJ [Motilimonas eburnea]
MDKSLPTHLQASAYYDVQSLNSLREAAQKDEKGTLSAVAKQFEAMFTGMLIKSMREANEAFETDSPFNNRHTKFYRQMQDQQLSLELSQSGTMGLAEVLTRQLDPTYGHSRREEGSPLKMPSGLDMLQTFAGQQPESERQITDQVGQTTTFSVPLRRSFPKPRVAELANESQAGTSAALNAALSEADLSKRIQSKAVQFDGPASFVQSLMPFAKKAAKTLGVNPAILVAQAALETGWGKKVIQTTNQDSSFNLFNIKADRRWQGAHTNKDTLEYYDGVAVTERARFRVYQDFEQSFSDYVNFLQQNPRYQHALKTTADPERFMRQLQKAGYATDPRYADKVMSVLKRVESHI